MTFKKTPLSRMGVIALQRRKDELIEKINEYKKELIDENYYRLNEKKLNDMGEYNDKIDIKIYELSKIIEPIPGIFNKILSNVQIPIKIKQEIEQLEIQKKYGEEYFNAQEIVFKQKKYLNWIEPLEKELRKISTYLNPLLERKEKFDSIKNKAADTTKAKRIVASTIKKKLGDNDSCPYCDEFILGDKHADHIYPLSKGGESTLKNMVMVCSKCNALKSNLTLQAFIKKYNLNRDLIEQRLDSLGKDY